MNFELILKKKMFLFRFQELKEKEDEIQNARIEIERLKEDGGESNEEVQTKMNNLQLQIEAQNQEIEAQRQEIDEHKGKAESLQKEFNGVKAELEQRLADKLKVSNHTFTRNLNFYLNFHKMKCKCFFSNFNAT